MPFEACEGRQILQSRMRADLKVYKEAVVSLDMDSGEQFSKVQQAAERARLAYEAAREKFSEHIASHGCGCVNV